LTLDGGGQDGNLNVAFGKGCKGGMGTELIFCADFPKTLLSTSWEVVAEGTLLITGCDGRVFVLLGILLDRGVSAVALDANEVFTNGPTGENKSESSSSLSSGGGAKMGLVAAPFTSFV
jgi:hypothetical protein